MTTNGQYPPLTLNQLAIVAASQNKLPTSRVKGIVARMGRHTQSSAKKLGRWYKGDNYVDNGNYSWRNMELFADYQKQMYNAEGTIKASCLNYFSVKQRREMQVRLLTVQMEDEVEVVWMKVRV
nr:hypothetical protein BaRGS_033844 [Batillaria attramentaria]